MFSNTVKHVLLDKGLKASDLAAALGCSRSNLSNKFNRDNFSEREMQQIADALGLKLVIKLEPGD